MIQHRIRQFLVILCFQSEIPSHPPWITVMQTRKANRENGCSSQLSISVYFGKNALLKVVNKVNFDTLWDTDALAANDGWYVDSG